MSSLVFISCLPPKFFIRWKKEKKNKIRCRDKGTQIVFWANDEDLDAQGAFLCYHVYEVLVVFMGTQKRSPLYLCSLLFCSDFYPLKRAMATQSIFS